MLWLIPVVVNCVYGWHITAKVVTWEWRILHGVKRWHLHHSNKDCYWHGHLKFFSEKPSNNIVNEKMLHEFLDLHYWSHWENLTEDPTPPTNLQTGDSSSHSLKLCPEIWKKVVDKNWTLKFHTTSMIT